MFCMYIKKRNVPWSVILNIVFLDLLDVVIGLRVIHSFRAVRRKVSSWSSVQAKKDVETYYFHAKSLNKHRGGSTTAIR